MSFSLPEVDPDDERYTKRGALHVPAGAGITKWISGDVYTMKATRTTTNGSLGLIEATVPPGRGSVRHAHLNEDEAFYVLTGDLEFVDGDRAFTARPGDFVWVPRGIRHSFTNGGVHAAKVLFLYTPAGTEELFIEAGDEPRPGEIGPEWTQEDTRQVLPLLEKYGMVLLPDIPQEPPA